MKTLTDLLEVIKFSKFLTNYTQINPNSGIRHRANGKGTNDTDKRTDLTETEKEAVKTGLQEMVKDINEVIEKI